MTRSPFLSLLLAALVAACATPPPTVAPPPPVAAPAPRGTLLEGVVRAASGQPVEGAWVSLIPTEPAWSPSTAPPVARVESSAGGRFRFEGAPAGIYGLSATAPGHATVFRVGVKLEADARVGDVELALAPEGHEVRGELRDGLGRALEQAAWVAISRISNEQGDVAYVRADARGAFAVTLPRGSYLLEALVPGHEGIRLAVETSAPRTVSLVVDAAPVSTPPSEEVVAWLKRAAVPLKTVEAGNGFEDLRPLAPWLAKARVVALGEATHGSREFFQLKHRMLEYLATEQGYTLFGIEANFAEALALNDYVLTGKGDPAAALAGLYFWTWDTEEVLALIRWMRAYNADPRHRRKLQFHGIDMQFSAGSARALLAYLEKVDAAYAQGVRARLTELLDNKRVHQQAETAPETLQPYADMLAEVGARLEARRQAYTRKSSARQWAFAARHAHLLARHVARSRLPHMSMEGSNERDRIMADNTLWLLEQEGPGAKMVLWAHNYHVSLQAEAEMLPLGHFLRERLGEALFVFGFAFHQGSFQAHHLPPPGEARRGVIEHTVPPAPPGSLDAVLASAGLPLHALNLREAPRDGAVGAFLQERRESRQIGSSYRRGSKGEALRAALMFDGLLFVESTRAATATPTGRRPPPPPEPRTP